MSFKLKWAGRCLDLDQRTHIMGVLNITPDSFSDGGMYFDRDKAVEHALAMERAGADFIDIGGESTRPFSEGISNDEEKARVIPVIERLAESLSVPMSIDTCKAEVAQAALAAGASIINDISALRVDGDLAGVAADARVPVILMHMQGTPKNMQRNPRYRDLMGEIKAFLARAVERALSAGVREDRIIVDPGIGFGKTLDHNLQIIRDLSDFQSLGKPVLIGPSNKTFIGHILGKEAHERDAGTMAAVAAGVMNGAHVVRVHRVKMAVETVRMIDAIKGGRFRAASSNDS